MKTLRSMKVIQFSIPRLKARVEAQRPHLIEKGVPPDLIEVFYGPDGNDYEKTYHIFESMVAEGFSHVQTWIDHKYDNWIGSSQTTQQWAYLRLLKYIIEKGETCLVIHDDWLIQEGRNYADFINIKEHAEQVAEREKTTLKYIAFHHTHLREDMFYPPNEIKPESILFRGVVSAGADIAFIITPAGAEWLLDNWTIINIHPVLECVFEVFMTEWKTIDSPFDINGIYSVNDLNYVISNSDFKSTIFSTVDAKSVYDGTKPLRPISETGRL